MAGALSSCVLAANLAAAADQTEATRTVARAFLQQLFVAGDVSRAYERHAAPDFVQHNPQMADGIAGRVAFSAAQARSARGKPSQWANVFDIVLVDGDLFAAFHHVFTGPGDRGRVFVDIWRVANGQIVEHWDVIQAVPQHLAHGNGMTCGSAGDYASARALGQTLDRPTCRAPDPQAARARSMAVIDAYTAGLSTGDVRGSILRWFSPDYIQHSPNIAPGVDGAIDYLQHEFGGHATRPKATPPRILAEGDYVLYHRQVMYPGAARPSVNVDIFRVTGGRISEHWDVKQTVPAKAANANGMW